MTRQYIGLNEWKKDIKFYLSSYADPKWKRVFLEQALQMPGYEVLGDEHLHGEEPDLIECYERKMGFLLRDTRKPLELDAETIALCQQEEVNRQAYLDELSGEYNHCEWTEEDIIEAQRL